MNKTSTERLEDPEDMGEVFVYREGVMEDICCAAIGFHKGGIPFLKTLKDKEATKTSAFAQWKKHCAFDSAPVVVRILSPELPDGRGSTLDAVELGLWGRGLHDPQNKEWRELFDPASKFISSVIFEGHAIARYLKEMGNIIEKSEESYAEPTLSVSSSDPTETLFDKVVLRT